MIKSVRFLLLLIAFVSMQIVAWGQPQERLVQVQVTPDHTNWLYKPGEKDVYKRQYYKWLTRIGRRNCWQPDKRFYHADDIAVSQSFLDLYRKYKDEAMIILSLIHI